MSRNVFCERAASIVSKVPPLPTIDVDGIRRPCVNSEGELIHSSEEGLLAFWRWFADSQVVDERGRPLVMYHGTAAEFDAFEPSAGDGNVLRGVYFTPDREEALSDYGDRLVEAYIAIANPAFSSDVFKRWGQGVANGDAMSDSLLEAGFDGALTNQPGAAMGHVVAFHARQICRLDSVQGLLANKKAIRRPCPDDEGMTP